MPVPKCCLAPIVGLLLTLQSLEQRPLCVLLGPPVGLVFSVLALGALKGGQDLEKFMQVSDILASIGA